MNKLSNSIAILQPYFFPYIPYFELIKSVETVVFLNDVMMGSRPFNHSNYICDQRGIRHNIGLEIVKKSSLKKYNEAIYLRPNKKILRKLNYVYAKAKNLDTMLHTFSKIINCNDRRVDRLNSASIIEICEMLGLNNKFYFSSEINYHREAEVNLKILSICEAFSADVYINPIGGINLYDPEIFKKAGIQLMFFNATSRKYNQFSGMDFVKNLSILDLLAHNNEKQIRKTLGLE